MDLTNYLIITCKIDTNACGMETTRAYVDYSAQSYTSCTRRDVNESRREVRYADSGSHGHRYCGATSGEEKPSFVVFCFCFFATVEGQRVGGGRAERTWSHISRPCRKLPSTYNHYLMFICLYFWKNRRDYNSSGCIRTMWYKGTFLKKFYTQIKFRININKCFPTYEF